MYDTATHVEMVKKRIRQRRREKEKRRIFSLSAICALLSAVLLGMTGTLAGCEQTALPGLYGSMLLHEGVGGYVLVGVIAFTASAAITIVCIRYRERSKKKQAEEEKKT